MRFTSLHALLPLLLTSLLLGLLLPVRPAN